MGFNRQIAHLTLALTLASCKPAKEPVIPEISDEPVIQKVERRDLDEVAPGYGVSLGQAFEVSLEPIDSKRVAVGERALVYANEGAIEVSCHVSRITRSASSEVGQAIAWLSQEHPSSVTAGDFVFARITLQKKKNALAVPRSAIYIKDGATLVVRQTRAKDGKTSYTPTEVETGVEAPDAVEIRSGLNDNDLVVTQGGIGSLFPNFKEADSD